MSSLVYDLWYDASGVDAEMVVETWISHGPRANDSAFDPQPGDWLIVGDDEEPPCSAQVIRRLGDRVWTQLRLAPSTTAPTGASTQQR
jgi:hypothetical protein